MKEKWYYVENKKSIGPINEHEVLEMYLSSKINKNTYVWKKGLESWTKFSNITELSDRVTTKDEWEVKKIGEVKNSFYTFTSETLGGDSNIYGPFSKNEIKILFQKKRISSHTKIVHVGDEKWYNANHFFDFIPVQEQKINKEQTNFSSPIWATFKVGRDFHVGIVRDVTKNGFQVLGRSYPLVPGEKIHLSLEVLSKKIQEVLAVNIVRFLPHEEGFFVRSLQDLPKNIVNYAQNSQLF